MYTGDLMVDNYVMVDNKIGKVAFISDAGYCLVRIDENHSIETDNPQPVPLTKEILENNEFKKSVSPSGIHAKCYELENKEEKYCLTIADYNKYKRLLLHIDCTDAECFNIKCDYVHQLQQALRLCEIEKTLEI